MFGWDYPPGAERDPFAPWNRPEEQEPDDTEPDDEGDDE